jgi:hypothetical protein
VDGQRDELRTAELEEQGLPPRRAVLRRLPFPWHRLSLALFRDSNIYVLIF